VKPRAKRANTAEKLRLERKLAGCQELEARMQGLRESWPWKGSTRSAC
jgi:hypothetical protein